MWNDLPEIEQACLAVLAVSKTPLSSWHLYASSAFHIAFWGSIKANENKGAAPEEAIEKAMLSLAKKIGDKEGLLKIAAIRTFGVKIPSQRGFTLIVDEMISSGWISPPRKVAGIVFYSITPFAKKAIAKDVAALPLPDP